MSPPIYFTNMHKQTYNVIMQAYTHPLTLQVQELFIDSDLTPDVTCLLLAELNTYFETRTIAHSDNLPVLVKTLYARNDNAMYSIISVCDVGGYEAVLITPLQHIIKESSQQALTYLKASGQYEGVTLHTEISKLNALLKVVLELLKNSTRTSRKAIGDSVKEIDFPDDETLQVFYECGRKVSYDSLEEGEDSLDEENNVYLCRHCNKYHQGRASAVNAPPVDYEVKLGRYKTAWRRYHKI